MRKIVPPTSPARPPAVPAPAKAPPKPATSAPPTTYAPTPRPRRETRIARIAFFITLALTLGGIAFLLLASPFLKFTWEHIRGLSLGESFVVCFWGFALAPLVMAAANALAALAFFFASRGKYAGNVLITYGLCQATLLVIVFSSVFTLVGLGTIRYLRDGQTMTLHVPKSVLLHTAATVATLCLPLLAFVIPPLRRACFNSTNN